LTGDFSSDSLTGGGCRISGGLTGGCRISGGLTGGGYQVEYPPAPVDLDAFCPLHRG